MSDKLTFISPQTLTGASGTLVLTHALVQHGAPTPAHSFDVVKKTDATATFHWWITAHTTTQATLNWAGGAGSQDIVFVAQVFHSLMASDVPVTWA